MNQKNKNTQNQLKNQKS